MSSPLTPDLIEVRGIRARGFHGVFPEEKREGQDFLVDLALEADLSPAGRSDDLADTVDYGAMAALAVARVEGRSFDLIERLAVAIADDILAAPSCRLLLDAVTVTVHKPQAPVGVPFGDVTVRVRRERPTVPVVIALGTNLGDRYATLALAELEVAERLCVGPLVVSDYVETDPVGGPGQPDYLNAVAVGRTRLSPTTVLARLHGIEDAAGRVRDVRWGPRTLDLDLVQYGDPAAGTDVVSDADRLMLPHPRAHERGFVLLPWLDADPEATLRLDGEVYAVRALAQGVDAGGIRPAGHPGSRPDRPGATEPNGAGSDAAAPDDGCCGGGCAGC
jgi:dihydroneopterin aldolase / 2-amino-4-hydroxy-6-hydroxymethyldihydropteridine diphosphokinase